MILNRALLASLLALSASAAAAKKDDDPLPPLPKSAVESPLADYFACLSDRNEAAVAAHRGGRYQGFPENALETFAESVREGVTILEVDVASTSDDVLVIFHDDELERMTTGKGELADKTYEQVQELILKDEGGVLTSFRIPTFKAALDWADGRAILEVDIKNSASADAVIDEIKAAGAEKRVILIAYTLDDALLYRRLAPNALISTSVTSLDALESAIDAGLHESAILAWTGNRDINNELFGQLTERGVPVIFGTLGRQNSLDIRFFYDGDASEYSELEEAGVNLIASDLPVEALEVVGAPSCAAPLGQTRP